MVSLDADFLGDSAASVRYARDYADGRFADGDAAAASRLYVVESTPSMTGCMADHRMALESGRIEAFAHALAEQLGIAFDSRGGPTRNIRSGSMRSRMTCAQTVALLSWWSERRNRRGCTHWGTF